MPNGEPSASCHCERSEAVSRQARGLLRRLRRLAMTRMDMWVGCYVLRACFFSGQAGKPVLRACFFSVQAGKPVYGPVFWTQVGKPVLRACFLGTGCKACPMGLPVRRQPSTVLQPSDNAVAPEEVTGESSSRARPGRVRVVSRSSEGFLTSRYTSPLRCL